MKKTFLFSSFLLLVLITSIICVQSCKNQSAQNKQAAAANKGFQFKDKLSEYGFFKGRMADLDPEPGIIKYELSTPLFTDYAVKDRFIVLPKGMSAKYVSAGLLDFPDSTIILKDFAYNNPQHQKILIETRMLVKDPADGEWKVTDYLWNKEQTDAVRHITGARLPIILLDDDGNKISTNYQVPNTNDCKRCHNNNGILTPIGPKARNLNFVVAGQDVNQLRQWVAEGKLTGLSDTTKVVQLPDWKDSEHFSLDQRARAYLDVNCAHCHIKGGDAYNTGLFLDYEQTDKDHLGIMKVPVSAGGGAGGLNYDIIPGDAAHSVLAYRMNSVAPGTAMPELGRTLIHKEGVQLITAWINSMK